MTLHLTFENFHQMHKSYFFEHPLDVELDLNVGMSSAIGDRDRGGGGGRARGGGGGGGGGYAKVAERDRGGKTLDLIEEMDDALATCRLSISELHPSVQDAEVERGKYSQIVNSLFWRCSHSMWFIPTCKTRKEF